MLRRTLEGLLYWLVFSFAFGVWLGHWLAKHPLADELTESE